MGGVTRGQSLFRGGRVRPFCHLYTNCHETQRPSAGHDRDHTRRDANPKSEMHFGGADREPYEWWWCVVVVVVVGRGALEGKGPQSRPQKRSDRRLEEVAKAVGAVTVG